MNSTLQTLSIRLVILGIVFFTACDEKTEPAVVISPITDTEIIKIPVVVHVLYATEAYNISDEKIHSQIQVLNQDFRKRNADYTNTPTEFAHLVTDVGIEFELATTDPEGKPTTGITRTHTDVDGLSGTSKAGVPIEELPLYFTSKGGHDAWPTDRYLNIWVADMSNRHGGLSLAGYAHRPDEDPRINGIVIDPRAFGTTEPLLYPYERGRTATHEIGHWLNLLHIFGSSDSCESTDFVDDTPSTATRFTGKPAHPQISCGHANMFMNFMDLVDDDAMCMFTHGQRKRMRDVFVPGGGREQLYINIKKSAQ